LRFEHPLFEGRGQALLRWLGIAPTRQAYIEWLVRAMPEGAGNAWLKSVGKRPFTTATTARDVRVVLKGLSKPCSGAPPGEGLMLARTCRGFGFDDPLTPEQVAVARSERASLERGLSCLGLRRKRTIAEGFGLLGMRSRTTAELAADRGVSTTRARTLIQQALRTLRGSRGSEDDRAVILPRFGRAPNIPLPVAQVAASHGQSSVDGWVLLETPWSLQDAQRAIERFLAGLGLPPLHWESLAEPVEWRDAEGKDVALVELPAGRGGPAFRAWSYQSFELGCEAEAEPRHECGVTLDGLPGGMSLELRGRGTCLEEHRTLWDDRGTTLRQARSSHVLREWASVLGGTTRRPKRLRRRS
jgi:hypothetical protein